MTPACKASLGSGPRPWGSAPRARLHSCECWRDWPGHIGRSEPARFGLNRGVLEGPLWSWPRFAQDHQRRAYLSEHAQRNLAT